jgi:hypothetical protein
MRRTLVLWMVAGLFLACSNSGKQPILEADGTLPDIDGGLQTDGPAGEQSAQQDVTATNDERGFDAVVPEDHGLDQSEMPDLALQDLPLPQDLVTTTDLQDEIMSADIVPLGPTCGDIFKCGLAKGCGVTGDICWATCFGVATEMELAAFKGITDCVGAFCEELPPEAQGDCLMSQCLDPVLVCLGGKGTSDCITTFQCIQGCGQDDGLCYFECIEGADANSLELLIDMSNATEQEMFSLLIECAGGNGEMSCAETVGCITSCEDSAPQPEDPADDPVMDCMIGCLSGSSAEGADDLLAFLACADEQCPDGMDQCANMFACLGECPGLLF